jgi:Zn-dependent M28 family amino/carboxypeptidase
MTVTALALGLEDVLAEACARIGRILQDDGAPQVGAYYRSDHYPFAKRGVPALFAVGNPRPEEMTESNPVNARFTEYMQNGYHKVGDEYDPKTWDMAGIEGDVRVYFETAWRVADSTKYPNWRYKNEFRALRDAMMSANPGGKRAASP